jgi:hypothetical protein
MSQSGPEPDIRFCKERTFTRPTGLPLGEDVAYRGHVGDEGDDPHLVPTLNGMDAPFLNRHRDAKVEVQANHF